MQDGGGLYYMSSSFMIDTLIGLPDYFGDRYAWSLDEYLEMEQNLPEGTIMRNYIDRMTLIEDMSAYYMDKTVDWEAGTCRFDSEAYISILDYCVSIRTPGPVSADNDVLVNGMFLCSPNLLEGKTRLEQVWTLFPWTLAAEDKFAGQALSWIGYPTFDGGCGSRVQLSNRVSVCADSENADGCWAFLKFLLTWESAENSLKWNGLPVYRPLFDEVVSLAAQDEKMTIEDGERLAAFAAQLTYIPPATHELYGIVRDEAEKLLNGTRNSRETSAAIQSRAALYVMERS